MTVSVGRLRPCPILDFKFVRPGESKTREFSPGPGTYTMYCVLANHEELGMYGTLKVD